MYNILEHKQAIAENIQKAFGDTQEDIEKAKWQIGEIRTDSRGIAHECYEYTADGKPRLRRVKKNKGASTDNGGSKKNVVDISKISDKEFKNITKILEKKNPKDSDAFRYLESEEMSDKELDNFIACTKHFKNDTKNINERTRKWCAKWEELGEEERENRKNSKKKQEDNKKEDDTQSKKKVVPIQETDKAVKLKCLFELEYSPKGGFTSSLVKDKSITIDSWFPKSALEENGSPKDWIIRKREKELSEKYLPLNSQVLSAKLHILI